jgi:pyrimidine deaminase RibD-like protein
MVDDTSRTGGASGDAATLNDPKATEWMAQAIEIGHQGDPSPNPHVGALIVKDGQVVGTGFHASAGERHAEIVALDQAGERARGATLYVTLEPCDMCVGAMFHARIARTVYGAKDPKKLVLKNQVRIEGGVMAEECGAILSTFFAARR